MNTVIFNSITEVPRWIDNHPRAGLNDSSSDTTHKPEKYWDFALGYEGAMEMARNGGNWEEGANSVMDAHVYMEELKLTAKVEELENDVAGMMVDVDAFISGAPDAMLNIEESDSDSRPIVSIGVQLYQPAGTDGQALFNRGAAILSVVDDLEAQGYRVELWGCLSNPEGPNGGSIDLRVCLKEAHDVWSAASVAFGLCHPAFGRRLGWRVAEGFEENQRTGYLGSHGCKDWDKDEPRGAEFDIWFTYMDVSHSAYDSKDKALERVSGIVNKELRQMLEYKAA